LKPAIAFALFLSVLQGQTVRATGSVTVIQQVKGKPADHANAVVSLKPVGGPHGSETAAAKARFQMIQRHKRFEPHLLAIPAGAMVEFPNLDPFFHNVFSMFDGNRFDLGLYESGKSHAVAFSKPGVNYIFCNIHPEMSAIIVVLDTPYYGVSDHSGEFTIPGVPAGNYFVSVWHERAKPEHPEEFPRTTVISEANPALGQIRLIDSGQLSLPHKNKYGHDYDSPAPPVIYK